MILVVSELVTDRILKQLSALKETAYPIGEITPGTGKVTLLGL
jgi:phosphoribosylaminoimidazole (AIR) synthetase